MNNPWVYGLAIANNVVKASDLPASKGRYVPRKGKLIAPAQLHSARFTRSLKAVISKITVSEKDITALRELGLHSPEKLRSVLLEAHRILDKSKVTAADWVGRVLEVHGPMLQEVVIIEIAAAKEFMSFANKHVSEKMAGFTFMNGYFEMAGVKKPFNKVEFVRGVKIKRPGQVEGVEYVDRAILISNAYGQKILISVEFKTRGAAGDLKRQIAERDNRMFGVENEEGTKLTYEVEGKPEKLHETDLENIILLRDARDPSRLRPEDFFSKIGVRAGKTFKVSPAKDAQGNEYIRVVVPVNTDILRRIIEMILRDRSWQ
jgi:hypothetical protein